MDVTSTQALTAAAPISPEVQDKANSVISSDFETFLKMLTAQAKYQDPLEPINSSEYAAQLAQFSSVEQQVLTNDLLTSMAGQFGAANMAQYSGWIGMDARSTAPSYFSGNPIDVAPNAAEVADEMTLIVYNELGKEVQKVALETTEATYRWSGLDETGTAFPQGLYSFEVESRSEGQLVSTTQAEAYGRVTETRLEGGQTVLIMSGGVSVPAASATALREPS